ncbi:MAG: DNA adenine methylase [Polyangiaceae bacterium]
MRARPVLKWAGGKTQLLDRVLARLPQRIRTYYEPFVGGGAVFFALAEEGRFERAVLSDTNEDLLSVYRALQGDVDALLSALRRLARAHGREHYYRVRSSKPRGLVQRAARMIYLNKTGYNGLYRVNSRGEFNVPFGRYENPSIVNEPVLRNAARVLSRVRLETGDFQEVCTRARRGDAVYFDPPYLPLSKTSNFAAYDRTPFALESHERLAEVFAALGRRGVAAVLSNSLTPDTKRLFASFEHEVVQVTRPINSKSTGRGRIPELLVENRPKRRR